MLTMEGVVLVLAMGGLLWRQRGFDDKRPWVTVVLVGVGALWVAYEGLPRMVDLARFGIAAVVAQAVRVGGRARAVVFAATITLFLCGPQGHAWGSWPLSLAATLLMLGLPRPLPTAQAEE